MPEPTNLPGNAQNSCRFLRSKEMYIDAEPDPTVPSGRSGHFWCVHTQTVIGPDGRIVHQDECHSERMCFESI
jgi:hypothetical protein